MKKLILLIVGVLVITTAFSQSILKINNDTVMCFNKKELSLLVKDIVAKKYNDSILKETNNQLYLYSTNLNTCVNALDSTKLTINEYKKLVDFYKEDSTIQTSKIKLLNRNNDDLYIMINEKNRVIAKQEKKIKVLKKVSTVSISALIIAVIIIVLL